MCVCVCVCVCVCESERMDPNGFILSSHLRLLATKEGVALQPFGLCIAGYVAEYFVIVRVHSAVGNPG